MSNSNTASAATSGALSSAGVLAHMADRAAQEHGLSGDARQQLYTYIIQCSPSIDLLWAYAAALRSTATSEAAIEKVNELFTKIDTLLKMVHQEYQPSKTQGTMVKKLMRRYTVTTKTGYDTLVERTKKYISQHPTQLSLELYNTDSTVKSVVNKFIQHESYQCRGTFRKAIFNEVLGGRVIADASNRICNLLSAGVSDPPPRYIQAHIAQLRLIARERINSIRETEAFVAAQAANNGTTIATSHRPRSDTLFWEVVNARFKELVAHNTIIYDGNPGWTQWEDEVLAADAALFTGQTEFPGENGDDFMGDGGDGGEEWQIDSSSTKKKKKKKKASPATPSMVTSSAPTNTTTKPTKAQNNKSGKDEIDLALEELATKFPDLQTSVKAAQASTSGTASTTAQTLFSLLSASLKDFDSEAEMRRFFGSKVVNSAKPAQRVQKVSRSHLTKPTQQWGLAGTPHGISMVPLDDYERKRKGYVRNGEKWWNIEHSVDYKRTQLKFLHCVTLSEPSQLFALYRSEPWHIDTLLQIGEILKHQEGKAICTQASDFVERAIYVFERALPVAFDLTSGSSRLDFDRIENRPFFLALHRHVLSLSRRGTPRTAFEFARLLFALDPVGDPHGAAFYLDFLSVKASMGQWLLDVWDIWPEARREVADNPLASHGIDVRCLPGWAYTRALILYDMENKKRDGVHQASTVALTDAILSFPEVVPYLVDKAGINLPSKIRAHTALRIETEYNYNDPAGSALHMLGHLYALRANSLWKNEPHSNWLVSTITSAESQLGSSTPARDAAYAHFAQGSTEAMARHANVADLRAISAYRKPDPNHSVTHAYDPFTPSTSLSNYDESYFQDVPRASSSSRGGPGANMPGGFLDEDDQDIDLGGVDPQVLINQLMDQAEAGGQARLDPGLLQRLFARFVGGGDGDGGAEGQPGLAEE